MKHVDMRKLPAAAQEERRRQVIGLRQAGHAQVAVDELEVAQDVGAADVEGVVGAGRQQCPLCTQPLDAAGHVCPRQNGYRRVAAS